MADSNDTDGKYEKYRSSGIALMATVSTLCAGATFGLSATFKEQYLWNFYFPIVLGLLQQLLNYIGSKWLARNAFDMDWAKFMESSHEAVDKGPENLKPLLPLIQKDFQDAMRKQRSSKEKSDKYFGYADLLCVSTVVTFIFLSFTAVLCLKYDLKAVPNDSPIVVGTLRAPQKWKAGPRR